MLDPLDAPDALAAFIRAYRHARSRRLRRGVLAVRRLGRWRGRMADAVQEQRDKLTAEHRQRRAEH